MLTTLVPTVLDADVDALHRDVSARRPDLLHPKLAEVRLRDRGAGELALLDASTVCVVLREWARKGRA